MKSLFKHPIAILVSAIVAVSFPTATAHAGEKNLAGPNGGKLVGTTAPDHAELVIADDGTLSVTFLDAAKKKIAPGTRTAVVFAQLEAGRQEVELAVKGDAFVSKTPLPKPEGYTLVVQIRPAPDAKPVNTRVTYATHVCGGCKLKEYACTCESH